MAVTCDKVGTGCELDASLPMARWPAGRYRAEVSVLKGGAAVGRAVRTFDIVAVPGAVEAPVSVTTASPAAVPRPAALDALLSRATAYVEHLRHRAVSTVAEERYVQAIVDSPLIDRAEALTWRERQEEARRRTPGVAARRQISADLLMVKSDAGWLVPYRDVAAVDGRPVKDRSMRAMQLFTSGGTPSLATLRQITEEGARYNLGTLRRTVNVPTMALFVLHPRHIARFEFELAGTESNRRDGDDGGPVPREARSDADPDRPARQPVLDRPPVDRRRWQRAPDAFHVEDGQSGIRTRVEATYRDVPSLGLLLPAEMRESYTNIPGDRLRSIEGRADLPELPRVPSVDVGRRGGHSLSGALRDRRASASACRVARARAPSSADPPASTRD